MPGIRSRLISIYMYDVVGTAGCSSKSHDFMRVNEP